MDFPLFELHGCGKRSGTPPKTIYSEVPSLPLPKPPSPDPSRRASRSDCARRKIVCIGFQTMAQVCRFGWGTLYQYGARKFPLLCKVDKHIFLLSLYKAVGKFCNCISIALVGYWISALELEEKNTLHREEPTGLFDEILGRIKR